MRVALCEGIRTASVEPVQELSAGGGILHASESTNRKFNELESKVSKDLR